MELDERKKLLRTESVLRRAAAHELLSEDAPSRLAARGIPFVPSGAGSVLSGFHPYQSEIDVRPLMGRLAGEGWVTALPVVLGKNLPLQFRRWYAGEPTVAGKWEIQIPPEVSPILVPDVLLVPMLAFDRAGFRLGYGGGFYDRTLEAIRKEKQIIAIGVAYAAQQLDEVLHGPHDQQLDYVMTESEMFKCG